MGWLLVVFLLDLVMNAVKRTRLVFMGNQVCSCYLKGKLREVGAMWSIPGGNKTRTLLLGFDVALY
jgi:hypothetical protein